ncbi:hypothetical protein Nepgr_032080 [Nepenthes gracilis]|uniref:Uncharacterized protein n=1 Tax=Nepenthes gracilis TaxID=150966 RepID=A0AAD3Y5D1_NEPGR|nr:hypothetical protein Nepgr_032080 [Nepenthes gracilis]
MALPLMLLPHKERERERERERESCLNGLIFFVCLIGEYCPFGWYESSDCSDFTLIAAVFLRISISLQILQSCGSKAKSVRGEQNIKGSDDWSVQVLRGTF